MLLWYFLTPLYLVERLLEIRGNKFGKNVDNKKSECNLKSDKHEILSVDWYLNVEASKAPPDIKGTTYDHLAPENRFPKPVTVKRNNSMPVSYRSKHRKYFSYHHYLITIKTNLYL